MTEPPRRPGFADEPPTLAAPPQPRRPTMIDAPEGAGAVVPVWSPRTLSGPGEGWGTLGLAAAGGAVLLGAWAVVGLAGMVAAQFAASPLLGWLGAVAVAAGLGLIGAALWREVRALGALAVVERLRESLADPTAPLEPTREAALAWTRDVAARVPEAGRVIPALSAAGSVEEIAAHLRAGVVSRLAEEAARIGRRAAIEGGAMVALSPAPSLDAVVAGWRGLKVVREVAALHGLRPGVAATRRLLARTVSIAATTAGADLIAQTAAESLVGATPVVKDLAASVPGAGVAAFRLYRLAVATAAACSPVPGR